jgi:hypothetical protein
MLAYLFRDQGGSNAFAYSTDVTGRSLPRLTQQSRWAFVAAGDLKDLDDREKVVSDLRVRSYCIFQQARDLGGATFETAEF